jgi:hypothetical protein
VSALRPAIEAAGLGRDHGSTRALDSFDLSLLTLAVTSLVVFGLTARLFDPEHRFIRRGAP